MAKRTIFIGDVHGCIDELEMLLKKVDYRHARDRLIFVGDLINKGPHSLKVVELVRHLNAECIKGNHELRFIEYVKNQEKDRPKWDAIKKEFGENLRDHVAWLDKLPIYIEDPEFIVVHAGLHPEKNLQQSSDYVLSNIRTWDGVGRDLNNPHHAAWYSFYNGEKLVVYGHWAVQGLNIRTHTIGLDSGCVYGKQLSALILPTREIVQVQAKRPYCLID